MNRNKYLVLVHVAAWSLMYLTPLSFFSHDNGNNLALSLAICMAPLLQMVAFYTNYFRDTLVLVQFVHLIAYFTETFWILK